MIADVGQNAYEEINVGLAANYGWPCREGAHAYRSDPGLRRRRDRRPGRSRRATRRDGYCSIIGGYVVRDPGLPTLAGRYLYGDYCKPAAALVGPGERRRATPRSGSGAAA